jgi:hypothetical protein
MNESIERRLERIIERAVRPISASRSRKSAIHEELVVHVTSVFDEELDRLGDEETAFAATRERFGIEEELGWQLQDCVPQLERWFLISEREILMSRWFWLLAVVAVAVGPGFVLPAVAKFNAEGVMTWGFFLLGLAITLAGLGGIFYGVVKRFANST